MLLARPGGMLGFFIFRIPLPPEVGVLMSLALPRLLGFPGLCAHCKLITATYFRV